jgi:LacI family transcriptional regulator
MRVVRNRSIMRAAVDRKAASSKMVTLKDIAAKCGVDISTVSKVIHGREIRVSESTRLKIMEAAEALHYRPNALARSLRTRRAGAIVLAISSTARYVYPEIVDGAQEKAEDLGICLFIHCYSPRQTATESLIALAQEGRFDGVMFHDLPHEGFVNDLREAGVPFVSLNRYASVGERYVCLDDETGFRTQAEYLADLGFRQIGFVGVRPDSDISRRCKNAFCSALADRGIPISPSLLFSCDFDGLDFVRVATEISSGTRRPNAVATASVVTAVHLMAALKGQGVRIPEDLSVIGYHDAPIAAWHRPGLTTVRMPFRIQGARAVERLHELLNGIEGPGEIISVAPEIVERESCLRLT